MNAGLGEVGSLYVILEVQWLSLPGHSDKLFLSNSFFASLGPGGLLRPAQLPLVIPGYLTAHCPKDNSPAS